MSEEQQNTSTADNPLPARMDAIPGIEGDTPDERVQALKEMFAAKKLESDIAEDERILSGAAEVEPNVDADAPSSPETPAAKADAAPAVAEVEAKRHEERRARIASLRDKQEKRERDLRSNKAAQARQAREAEYQTVAQRAQQYEAIQAQLKDPVGIIRYAQQNGVDPLDVANALRESIENPAFALARDAREAVSPELQAIRDELAALKREQQTVGQRLAAERQQAAEAAAQRELVSAVGDDTPLSKQVIAVLGQDRFIKMCELQASRLPPGAGLKALLDVVEESLEQERDGVAKVYGFGAPSKATTPTKQSTSSAKADPAKTISNSLAASRTTVEDEPRSLTMEERIRRTEAIARRMLLGG